MWGTVVKLRLSMRSLAVEPGSVPGALASLLESTHYDGIPCSDLIQGEGLFPAPTYCARLC